MSRSGRLFLQDMLECAQKVVRYTAHLTREQFLQERSSAQPDTAAGVCEPVCNF
jgi:uncharacterized protein with HEPN domain